MYEVKVDRVGAYSYKAASGAYSITVDLPAEGRPAGGMTPPAVLLASLGSCVGVYCERYLTGGKIPFERFSVTVKSDISKESPRFMREIAVEVRLEGVGLDERRKAALLEFIKNCPVHNTLLHRPSVSVVLK